MQTVFVVYLSALCLTSVNSLPTQTGGGSGEAVSDKISAFFTNQPNHAGRMSVAFFFDVSKNMGQENLAVTKDVVIRALTNVADAGFNSEIYAAIITCGKDSTATNGKLYSDRTSYYQVMKIDEIINEINANVIIDDESEESNLLVPLLDGGVGVTLLRSELSDNHMADLDSESDYHYAFDENLYIVASSGTISDKEFISNISNNKPARFVGDWLRRGNIDVITLSTAEDKTAQDELKKIAKDDGHSFFI